MAPTIPVNRRSAVLFAAAAAALVLLLALVTWFRATDPAGDRRVVELGVDDVLAVDRRGHDRLRLTAVAADAGGHPTLFFRPDDVQGPARLRLADGSPLTRGRRRLTLEAVRVDPRRGEALQIQWAPLDTTAPRPLVTVGDEPVALPGGDGSLEVAISGVVPPPGPTAVARLRLLAAGRVLAEGTLRPGEALPVPGMGRLRWLGTRERFLARIRIEPAR